MKIISWNVNGIRSALKKGFMDFIKSEDADIICLQEVRAEEEQVDLSELSSYNIYWNSAQKKGYSGTAVFSRKKPNEIVYDLPSDKHNGEGRVITLEFDQFSLVNVYTPNSKRELLRLDYRYNEWDRDFLSYLKDLEKTTGKPVIFCGDLNVAHKEIDLTNPSQNRKNAGFTDQEREGFDNFISNGFVDTFREFCKEGGHYTWWSNFANSRARNIGWRIDYFCVSSMLKDRLVNSEIMPQIMGSDHCPIKLTINLD